MGSKTRKRKTRERCKLKGKRCLYKYGVRTCRNKKYQSVYGMSYGGATRSNRSLYF